MRVVVNHLVASAMLVAAAWSPVSAQDTQHCPAVDAKDTHVFGSEDKGKLESLANALAKAARPVCILAFTDPQEPGHSKMIAFRRAVWARETLVGKGVKRDLIAMELRPLPSDQDRGGLRMVNVLVGR